MGAGRAAAQPITAEIIVATNATSEIEEAISELNQLVTISEAGERQALPRE